MWLKNRTIGFHFMCGFGIVAILTLSLGLFALAKMHTLADLTVKIQRHPLAVSNAVRDIRADIFVIHRTMKDAALSDNDEQINTAMEHVDQHEQNVFKSFDILFERFLGDQSDVQKAHKAFMDWKAIREEVHELMHQGKRDQAEAITRGKGNDQVDYMLDAIKVMSDFANAKAEEFYESSQRIRVHQEFLLNTLIAIIIASNITIGIVISKSIAVPIRKIIREIKEVAKGDFSRKVSIDSTKELDQLASEFNDMASKLNKSTTSIDNLNKEITQRELVEHNLKAANQQLRSTNQQLGASDQQLRSAEQQLQASNQQLRVNEESLEQKNHNLNERVKELICMYGVEESIRKHFTLNTIFNDIVELIPPGWQYPEITKAKILFEGKKYCLETFEETQWKQSSDIIVHGECKGSIEVYYLEQRPTQDEGPFLKEEQDLLGAISSTLSQAVEQRIAKQKVVINQKKFEVLYNLSQMVNRSEEQIKNYALEEGLRLVDSKIGYLLFVNKEETELTLHLWSKKAMSVCGMNDKPTVFKIEESGLMGEAVRQRKAVITNDYNAPNPFKKGCPEGHIPIKRHMNVPLIDNGKIVLVAGAGNKEEEYNETDVRLLTLIMDRMWHIIQRKHHEKELNNLLKDLSQKNDELESILYVSAHDLKSPIVNIQGFSRQLLEICKELQGLLEKQELPEEVTHEIGTFFDESIPGTLEFITAGSVRIKQLLDGLLKVLRFNREEIIPQFIDMNQLIRDIQKKVSCQSRQHEIAFTLDDLPDCEADRKQIEQIFINLIDNALKYTKPDNKGSIHISGRIENDMSIFCIEDNGIGINPDYQGKIFELFHRLNPRGDVEGEGLGLTIVKRALQRQGGDIWLESEPDKGSKFFVSLPHCREEALLETTERVGQGV